MKSPILYISILKLTEDIIKFIIGTLYLDLFVVLRFVNPTNDVSLTELFLQLKCSAISYYFTF